MSFSLKLYREPYITLRLKSIPKTIYYFFFLGLGRTCSLWSQHLEEFEKGNSYQNSLGKTTELSLIHANPRIEFISLYMSTLISLSMQH
jgi:hypothetical protein